ncbi:MAG TPA: hypothetical protein VIL65_09545 [Beijerinckiaceae bacterium]|jgi:hypothetical protein
MPLYFFHVIDGAFLVDDTGTHCATMEEVRRQAIRTAGEILADMGEKFTFGTEWQMHVTDHLKQTVFRLRFSADVPKPYFDPTK